MKKKFLITILGLSFAVELCNNAFAENFTYKVYNPKTNKTTTNVLGTLSVSETQYVWGFYTSDGKPVCVINLNTNKNNQGLVGGKCNDFSAFQRAFVNKENIDMSKYELGWRELSTDTFYREMNSIRQERALQGKYDH